MCECWCREELDLAKCYFVAGFGPVGVAGEGEGEVKVGFLG